MNQINDGKMKTQPARPPSGRIAHLFRFFVCFADFFTYGAEQEILIDKF
jgi:hypothetical protein